MLFEPSHLSAARETVVCLWKQTPSIVRNQQAQLLLHTNKSHPKEAADGKVPRSLGQVPKQRGPLKGTCSPSTCV